MNNPPFFVRIEKSPPKNYKYMTPSKTGEQKGEFSSNEKKTPK